jgi:beta-lactamase regulating signal transducer with metallopeptidase domain
MSTHLLLEAAMRSLVMGVIIWAALRLLRIEQVRARRTAWLLALAGALGMPMLVSAQIGPRLLPELATLTARVQRVAAATAMPVTAPAATPAAQSEALSLGAGYRDYRGPFTDSHAGMMQAPLLSSGTPSMEDNNGGPTLGDTMLSLAVFGYCVVAAVLSLRLCAGMGFALRLRNQAERVIFPFDPELDVRTSARVAGPVTIGSSVLLPGNYSEWDAATLRIVLSHERAHVRQKDFLIHALAGLHCALFWFNPFSWWLQRQLAELGEALSDCAAVEQAESRTGYAEILLAFATRARWPLTGVAMANASNLTPRIERLLNDQGYERSFVKARRLPFIAAGVVALAMFASTSMVRVHATPTEIQTPPNPPAAPDTPATPVTPPAPVTPPPPATPASPATVSPPAPPAAVAPPAKKPVLVKRPAHSEFDADSDAGNRNIVVENDDAATDEEGVLAIKSDHSHMMFDGGNRLPSQSGDYIYFQHGGKIYLIQDPQIIAKAQALLAPMKLLGEQQRLLGSQQALLEEKQLKLSSTQRSIKLVESPEFKQRMLELQKTIKELDLPRLTVKIDPQSLEELQARLGEIQAHLGELQLDLAVRQGRFGEGMGKFGEQMGKFGEQQELLGEQQRKIIEDVRRQLKPIIEQAIREGKGKALSDSANAQ